MYSPRLLVQPFSEVPNRLCLCIFLAGTLSPASLQSLWTRFLFTAQSLLCPAESPHPAVTVARVLCGESDHPLHYSRVFADLHRNVTLARVRLAHYPTSPTLGDLKPLVQMLHSSPS